MRRFLLLLAAALFPLSTFAQQGTVYFDETIKLEIELPPEMASMRDQIPNSTTASKVFFFSESGTLMKNAPREEGEEGGVTVGGDGFMMRMMGPGDVDNQIFRDLENERIVEKRDFLGRTFLITGEPETFAWKLTGEQSEFLGFACMKAVAVRDSSVIEAWFTPEIPIAAGPDIYGGLPGLILVVSVDDGQRTITAKEVTFGDLEEGVLTPPTEGREVTREEFDRIVDEKMKEMGGQRGRGGATFHVRIGN